MVAIFGGFKAEFSGPVIFTIAQRRKNLASRGKLAGVQVVRSRRGKLAAVQFVVFE